MTVKKGDTTPKKMGRPPKEINWSQVETLCAIQCTADEICATLDVHIDTLCIASKKQYGCTFSDLFKRLREGGKCSLRRSQWKKAMEGNPTMLIWMGKQVLAQKDTIEFSNAQPITLAYDPHKLGDGE